MAEDPNDDDASGRRTENNDAIASQNNNSTTGTDSNAVSSVSSSSASLLATLAQMHQPQAQTSASTSTSQGSLSSETVSLLLRQQQQPILTGLTSHYLPIAAAQMQRATPAAPPAALTLNPLPRNIGAGGLIIPDAAQAPTISLPLQASLPHLASAQPGLGFSFPTSHILPPTNNVQRLLHLLDASSVSGLAATNAPSQLDQSQLLQQLLREIRIRIQAIAMILSQQQQASGNSNSSQPSAVSDETTNVIIAMLWQQQQEGGHDSPTSNADTLNQIASMLIPTLSRQQQQNQNQNQALGRNAVTSTSTRSNELELLLQSMASANNSNSTALNQLPSNASADIISQLLLPQQSGAHSAASYPPRAIRPNHLIAQLLSQLPQVQNNVDTHPSQGAASTRSGFQQIMASAQQPNPSSNQIESNVNHSAANNSSQGADRSATAAEGELQASACPPLHANQAPPPSFTQPPEGAPEIDTAGQSPTGATAAPHQSGMSHQKDESDMNPTQLSEARWMARYKELKEFKEKHGHCRVPHGYTDNRKLSWWVMNQRAQYQLLQQGKKSWLSEDRVELLNKIGMDWRNSVSAKPEKKKRKRDG